MNLLLLQPDEYSLALHDPRTKHILRVLKCGEGDVLKAGIVNGPLGTATIRTISDTTLTLAFEPSGPPRQLSPVTLLLGHPRPIVLKRMLRDLTAIGIAHLAIVHSALGERSYFESNLWDDLETPLEEGASQGGTTLLPLVTRHHTLSRALEALQGEYEQTSPCRIIVHPTDDRTLLPALRDAAGAPVVVAVGSERGWTQEEVDQCLDAGYRQVGLGPRILRTETAASLVAWAALESQRQSVGGSRRGGTGRVC